MDQQHFSEHIEYVCDRRNHHPCRSGGKSFAVTDIEKIRVCPVDHCGHTAGLSMVAGQ